MSEAKTVAVALRAETLDTATWKAFLTNASYSAIRLAIRECCLSSTGVCCNRKRIGHLALELVDRAERAASREQAALDRANRADAALEQLRSVQPATATAIKALVKQSAKKGGRK